jgi:hypothetical protein
MLIPSHGPALSVLSFLALSAALSPPPGTTPSNIHYPQTLHPAYPCLARGDVDMWKINMYSFKYGVETPGEAEKPVLVR